MMHKAPFSFTANGKLLLTGEYLVLKGAKSLALPLRKTQRVEIIPEETNGHPLLAWYAFGPENPWMKVLFELPSLDIIHSPDQQKTVKLQSILLTLKQLNPALFDGSHSYKVRTQLDFDPEWGLGTSSTLIAALARWGGVDPYNLLRLSIGGSGYDIACATAKAPIFFQLRNLRQEISKAGFYPAFAENLFFVYTGQKKDSSQGIIDFNRLTEDLDLEKETAMISALSEEAATTTSFIRFCELMDTHEKLLSALLKKPVIQSQYPGFEGQLKSLGAWGGDFMLAMTQHNKQEVVNFFSEKASGIVFAYHELVRS